MDWEKPVKSPLIEPMPQVQVAPEYDPRVSSSDEDMAMEGTQDQYFKNLQKTNQLAPVQIDPDAVQGNAKSTDIKMSWSETKPEEYPPFVASSEDKLLMHQLGL